MRELTTNEIDQVSGGSDLALIIGGIGVIGVGIALISTAGLASVPVAYFGAATLREGIVAASAMAIGSTGGGIVGTGVAGLTGIGASSGDGLKEKDS